MTPPPPSSTLFPYTTLFRSHLCRVRLRRSGVLSRQRDDARKCKRSTAISRRHIHPCRRATGGHRGVALPERGAKRRRDQDRKSTRLNSSHSQISYAVFCLKK